MTAVLQTAANEAESAGLVAPISSVELERQDSCLSSDGEWCHHAMLRLSVPIVTLDVCGASELLEVLTRGITTACAAGGVQCGDCGVQVSAL